MSRTHEIFELLENIEWIRERMKPSKSKSLCSGCYNDVYNHGCGGSTECWSFPGATVEKRFMIHVDQPPPYKQKPQWVLSCFKPQRMVNVKPEAIGKDGYWKS